MMNVVLFHPVIYKFNHKHRQYNSMLEFAYIILDNNNKIIKQTSHIIQNTASLLCEKNIYVKTGIDQNIMLNKGLNLFDSLRIIFYLGSISKQIIMVNKHDFLKSLEYDCFINGLSQYYNEIKTINFINIGDMIRYKISDFFIIKNIFHLRFMNSNTIYHLGSLHDYFFNFDILHNTTITITNIAIVDCMLLHKIYNKFIKLHVSKWHLLN
jgi:hypothetical protein